MTTHRLLEEYISRSELATALAVVPRTLARYEALPNGLPSVMIGGRKLYRLESVRRWIEGREQHPNARRGTRHARSS